MATYDTGPASGLSHMVQAFMGGGRSASSAYADEYSRLMRGAAAAGSAQKARIESDILADQLQHRRGLVAAFSAPGALPAGVDPVLAGRVTLAAPNFNPAQVGDYVGSMRDVARLDQGVAQAATDPVTAAFQVAAAGRNPPELYSQNAAGQVLGDFTGTTDATSPLTQAFIAERGAGAEADRALAAQRQAELDEGMAALEADRVRAQTGASRASADASRARAAKDRVGGEVGGGLKPADVNAIGRWVTALMGGTWDPRTGTIAGLAKDQAQAAAAIMADAERRVLEGVPHHQAVQEAAGAFGIQMPAAGGALTPSLGPGGGTGVADDPLGLYGQ